MLSPSGAHGAGGELEGFVEGSTDGVCIRSSVQRGPETAQGLSQASRGGEQHPGDPGTKAGGRALCQSQRTGPRGPSLISNAEAVAMTALPPKSDACHPPLPTVWATAVKRGT